MKTAADQSAPLRISFVGGAANQRLHDIAREEFQSLERLFGAPAYSHLIIRALEPEPPNACQVSLYLTMPGHIDVHVDVPAHADQWSDDAELAIRNAFHDARGIIADRLGHSRRRQALITE